MKSFITRLLSGIVLVAVIVLTCWRGGDILWALVLAISMIGLQEFYKVFGLKDPDDILAAAGYVGAAVWMILCRACSGSGQTLQMEKMWLVLPALFILILAVYVFTFPRYETQQVMAVFFGVVYIPVMLSFIYQTRMGDDGFYLVWLIFLCSWGCDTFAYCTGMLIGKHRLAPVLSPKKSIEGAVGGVLGTAAAAAATEKSCPPRAAFLCRFTLSRACAHIQARRRWSWRRAVPRARSLQGHRRPGDIRR